MTTAAEDILDFHLNAVKGIHQFQQTRMITFFPFDHHPPVGMGFEFFDDGGNLR
jgi:hypothetical protein